jgi:hypothetical protein
MPAENELIRCIPKIYKRSFENLGLFFFVEAQKQIIPTITVAQAIRNYYKFIGEDYNLDVARAIFSYLRSEYVDLKYKEHCEAAKKNSRDT